MEIQKISNNKFVVSSDSSDEQYKVSLSGENKDYIQCTCKGFVFRRDCKHIQGVRELLKKSGKKIKTKQVNEHFEFMNPYKESLLKLTKEILK